MTHSIILIGVAIAAVACNQKQEDVPQPVDRPAVRDSIAEQQVEGWLDKYDLSNKAAVVVNLPRKVNEASGLAVSSDGRLFTHDDERGVVYQIDHQSGEALKKFFVGTLTAHADFEGIAIAGDRFFMVTSGGNLFAFNEGADDERVKYDIYRTPLTASNDVEGLEYDPESNALLLPCKKYPGKGSEGYKAVYAVPLETMKMEKQPRLLIPLSAVSEKSRKGNFNPSGIALHPRSGTFFIISADGETIVELTKDGVVLGQRELSKKINPQPEGIAFAPDFSLLICNEGQGKTGYLVTYPLMTK
ncbi:MAG TPA: SdiA-regulated domain-containing protein [Bacteroidota bacterium]